jgi:hypothetical protein
MDRAYLDFERLYSLHCGLVFHLENQKENETAPVVLGTKGRFHRHHL